MVPMGAPPRMYHLGSGSSTIKLNQKRKRAISTAPFSIKIGDLGFFNKKTMNIVWVGVTRGKDEVMKLQKTTDKVTIRSGFAPELRKFKPHVTVGKKVIFNIGGMSNELPYFSEEIPVTRLTLFESHRMQGVLTYTPLYSQFLTGE